jgi:uncharacterized membrane protein YagU involved in acid resistance
MKNLSSRIITAGAIVGTLDIVAAAIYFFQATGSNPLNVLKYVASGVFGMAAFSGGNMMYLYGIILHFIIAFAFTIFFFWLFPRVKFFSQNKILAGIIYGVFVWMVMNLVVVKLSNVPRQPFDIVGAMITMIILIACIGIPLSYMANAFYKKPVSQDVSNK